MAIVSFWSDSEKETGQTLASVAIATLMAINHNFKILEVATGFKDRTVENCFWEQEKDDTLKDILGTRIRDVGMNNGIEGLVKVLQSNRTSTNVVADYAKVVFRERLDVLVAPSTTHRDAYDSITQYYPELVKIADKNYNIVFIDIDKRMKEEHKRAILQALDAIVITFKQGMDSLNEFDKLREKNPIFKMNRSLLLLGKYDRYSKYNTKNTSRYLKESRTISAISYNTLFGEAASEGKVADYFLKYRSLTDQTDKNVLFIQEAKKTCDNILYKLKELQAKV